MGLVETLKNYVQGWTGGEANSPLDTALGQTPEQVDPGTVLPRSAGTAGPYGASGRANFYGLPQPDELNQLLIGTTGLQTFDLMYRTDPDIRRLVLMSWSPIQAGTWNIEPANGEDASDQDREIADAVWWALTEFMSPNLYEHLAAVGPVLFRSGFAPFEQIWTHTTWEGKPLTVPQKLDVRLPRSIWRWWEDENAELTHLGQILPNKPDVVIPMSEIVYYRLGPEGNNWVGTSLLRYAYKPWYAKDKLERIDIIGQERKAVGVPFVYPPKGAKPETRQEVEALLASLHLNETSYGIMPGPKAGTQKEQTGDEWLVDVITFDSSSGDSVQNSLKYHRDAIASSFLGDFMQLGHHQVGARATAEVQMDPFVTAVEGIVEATVKPALQKLVDRIVHLNWGPDVMTPRINVSLTDSASLSELSTYVQQLVASGAMQPDPELEDYLRRRADLPAANADIREEREDARRAGIEMAAKQASEPSTDEQELGEPSEKNEREDNTPSKSGGEQEGKPAKTLDAGEPTVNWWETLLSQHRLGEAFKSIREHVTLAVGPKAGALARKAAWQAREGQTGALDTSQLEKAFHAHYQNQYRLGRETAQDELARQAHQLKKPIRLTGTVGGRSERIKKRASASAKLVAAAAVGAAAKAAIGSTDAAVIEKAAVDAAGSAVYAEAMTSAPVNIADGRYDTAIGNPDVVGAYVTSVMDANTCETCEGADTGEMVTVEEADALCPNPGCDGGARCRCQAIYVMGDDPTALGIIGGS